MADVSNAELQRAIARGAVIGLVAASHLALLGWIVAPRQSTVRKPHRHPVPRAVGVLRVVLLAPLPIETPNRAFSPARGSGSHPSAVPATASPTRGVRSPPINLTHATANPAPATSAFIAGGRFNQRLRATQTPPPIPRLPGGHHYLATDLQFVPVEQQSIAGKVNRVAGLLFGGFDPVCKNTEYELAKTREQMYADGYTMRELERRLREHHCP